jgi:hypothetical protein
MYKIGVAATHRQTRTRQATIISDVSITIVSDDNEHRIGEYQLCTWRAGCLLLSYEGP